MSGEPVHILLLDEQGAHLPVIEQVFGQLGQVLVRATSVEQAMALAAARDFALILIHAAGDAPDRFGAVRRIHRQRRCGHTPIIVVAPAPGPGFAVEDAYEAGAVDVLAGPLSAPVLKAKAQFFLDAWQSAAERARAEEALHDTQARLQSTLEAAELASWTLDLNTNRVSADPALAWLFNLTQADAHAGSVDAYLAAIHPADVAAAKAHIRAAIEDGDTYDATYRVRAANGQYRTVIARGQLGYGPDGKPASLRGVVIDITRLREAEDKLRASEERYRTLFESIDEGVCVVEMLFDPDGQPCDYRFLEMNSAFVQHTGLTDAVGKTMRALAPGHESHWFETYGRVATTGQPVRFVNEAKALGRWYDVYASRVGEAGSATVAILFNDITERVRADAELRRLAADLSDADRRKTEFLATLAHELRNPLAPIRSALQVMRLASADAATMERVQTIMDRQLNHMVELVDDLLDVARITRGQIELKNAWIDLKDVLGGAIETSLPLLDAAQHRLQLDIPQQPFPLYADATRITQVVSNLLNNAAKYTPRGGVVELSARREGGQALVTVSDNGVGIDAASLPFVFDMFTQVGRAKDRVQGGLGIGLSLVRSLVELHGGSVAAFSAGIGKGSSFSVTLPLALPACREVQPAAPATLPDAGAGALRILVVDDNVDAAETLSALLELSGHAALVANDGREALRMVQQLLPHLVFLDIGMPRMNGYEVARAIREELKLDDIVLVALTGWGGADDRARTKAAGFDRHMTKPVTIGAIEAFLANPAEWKARA